MTWIQREVRHVFTRSEGNERVETERECMERSYGHIMKVKTKAMFFVEMRVEVKGSGVNDYLQWETKEVMKQKRNWKAVSRFSQAFRSQETGLGTNLAHYSQ